MQYGQQLGFLYFTLYATLHMTNYRWIAISLRFKTSPRTHLTITCEVQYLRHFM